MPQQTKIFRVFISSTFTDMKLERGILQRDAFPRLEKFCEENGARFQAVDLRWGVNEESALDQKTLQICFNEIDRCQKISPKPNFLILLGDKYGWLPVPEIIPEIEMTAILNTLSGEEKELIEKWYWHDDNAIPVEYVLQARTGDIKEYKNWEPIELQIREILRSIAKLLNFTPTQLIKYFASATHQEIIRGALNPPEDIESPEKHVFAFSRIISGLPNDQSANGFIDLIGDVPDAESKTKLTKLKEELSGKLGKEHFISYTGSWEKGTLLLEPEELRKFNDRVYTELEKVIKEQLDKVVDKDEIIHEAKLHEEFKDKLTNHFSGREEILNLINDYLKNNNEHRVMSLIGVSGSGKSSVMAQTVKLHESNKAVAVVRFIGTTSGSSNIMSLLQSVCGQIAHGYGIDAKTLAREGDDKAWYDLNGLSDILRKCLALATAEKPILLFLDSLDQLSETDNAKALYWLPRELPEHARMIVSSLPELEDKLTASYKTELPVLPEKEAIEILKKWFEAVHRKLNDQQQSLVINSFNKTQLPIYLKLAFEKAKKWHSYDTGMSLKEDVPGIINDFFDELQRDYPEDFVKTVICFMLCGRYSGLAENEILEILAFDKEYWQKFIKTTHLEHQQELIDLKAELEYTKKETRGYMKIPIAVWSRLYLDLEPFLTERDADGVPIITFFHRQFNEVLRNRYELPDPSIQN